MWLEQTSLAEKNIKLFLMFKERKLIQSDSWNFWAVRSAWNITLKTLWITRWSH